MRRSLMTIALACAVPGSLLAQSFPYTATVTVEEAAVRSGPGGEYYATDTLRRGDQVEVYRLDDGEWLGIRPPEGSFSWVPEGALVLSEESGVAKVVREGTMAWIGARVGRVAQHKWQVTLSAGERVRVISSKRHLASLAEQDQSWYKIAPPAGEFRWIHQDDVRRKRPPKAPATELATRVTDSSSADSDSAEAGQPSPPGDQASDLHLTDLEVKPTDHQVSVSRSPSTSSTAEGGDGDGFTARADGAKGKRPSRSADSTPRETVLKPEFWDDELRALQLELSSTVARPMQLWDLAAVREKTQRLIEEGDSALKRGRARLLLDQISEFENLQRGKVPTAEAPSIAAEAALYVPPAESAGSNRRPSAAPSVDRSMSQSAARLGRLAAEGRYDGVGWLLPVHSQNRIAPRFALTDERGRVIQYIVPAPGRNLHRHLRKQVGVIGQRQSISGLGAPVLTASNVIELDRHR
jgi:uncharacterized protein YraI